MNSCCSASTLVKAVCWVESLKVELNFKNKPKARYCQKGKQKRAQGYSVMSKGDIRVGERESFPSVQFAFLHPLFILIKRTHIEGFSPVQFTFLLNNERTQLLLLSLSLLCIRLQQISSSNCLKQTFSKLQVSFQKRFFVEYYEFIII